MPKQGNRRISWSNWTKLYFLQEMQIDKRIDKLKKGKVKDSQSKVKVSGLFIILANTTFFIPMFNVVGCMLGAPYTRKYLILLICCNFAEYTSGRSRKVCFGKNSTRTLGWKTSTISNTDRLWERIYRSSLFTHNETCYIRCKCNRIGSCGPWK